MVLPYDYNPKNVIKTILIGKRDFRPLLAKIDDKVSQGFIVFDACYSKNSIRNNHKNIYQNVTASLLTTVKGYPYDNIVYIASSSTEAKAGKFSPLLDSCIENRLDVSAVKMCLNHKFRKSPQIPVFLGG